MGRPVKRRNLKFRGKAKVEIPGETWTNFLDGILTLSAGFYWSYLMQHTLILTLF